MLRSNLLLDTQKSFDAYVAWYKLINVNQAVKTHGKSLQFEIRLLKAIRNQQRPRLSLANAAVEITGDCINKARKQWADFACNGCPSLCAWAVHGALCFRASDEQGVKGSLLRGQTGEEWNLWSISVRITMPWGLVTGTDRKSEEKEETLECSQTWEEAHDSCLNVDISTLEKEVKLKKLH